MDVIFNVVFEVALRTLGLWLLKLVTFGRYKGTNSYLYFFPSLVGLVFLILLTVLILLAIGWIKTLG
ncbi:hypothetical protein RTH74_01190 [Pseudomonas sp. zfem001]|jgi:hypothetical protein|uniref:hypothetical protein n=1 Tax=Pseudomonas sp. zfem001 TaxID=3078196 RepID=UPI002929E763|nr:hypothetical protein [Pseudomonas sp. zfem001]MDU9406199.1 hypothetical protein [Pseudomonas sp. zfem001]